MAKRHYAIKYRSGKARIYHAEWKEIEGKILGKKGAVYKGFSNQDDAKEWLFKATVPFRDKNTPYSPGVFYVFVDGSYSSIKKSAGWGFVVIKDGKKVDEGWGVVRNLSEHSSSRNIVGELTAATKAMEWVNMHDLKNVVIVADYSGIANWALGYWKASTEVAMKYLKDIGGWLHRVTFEKVNGHSEIEWNEYADALTRRYQCSQFLNDDDESPSAE